MQVTIHDPPNKHLRNASFLDDEELELIRAGLERDENTAAAWRLIRKLESAEIVIIVEHPQSGFTASQTPKPTE